MNSILIRTLKAVCLWRLLCSMFPTMLFPPHATQVYEGLLHARCCMCTKHVTVCVCAHMHIYVGWRWGGWWGEGKMNKIRSFKEFIILMLKQDRMDTKWNHSPTHWSLNGFQRTVRMQRQSHIIPIPNRRAFLLLFTSIHQCQVKMINACFLIAKEWWWLLTTAALVQGLASLSLGHTQGADTPPWPEAHASHHHGSPHRIWEVTRDSS